MELAREARNGGFAFGVRAVAGRTRGNIGLRDSLLKDFLPRGDEISRATSHGGRVETFEMRGHGRSRLRAEAMHPRHVNENVSVAAAFGEIPQLTGDVFGLLAGH